MLSWSGPSNDRIYEVGVYFKNRLLAVGVGRSVQNAEKDAATKALKEHESMLEQSSYLHSIQLDQNFYNHILSHLLVELFKQLNFQREVIHKRYSEPFINNVLEKVHNYEPSFVNKFVEDDPKNSNEGRGRHHRNLHRNTDGFDLSAKRRRIEGTKEGSEELLTGSDMHVEDDVV